MEGPLNAFPPPAAGSPSSAASRPASPSPDVRRRGLLRRLLALTAASGLAFALTTWLLVRVENPASLLPFGLEPSSVVRAHLEALNRGDLRGAYGMFSQHYRAQVSFEAYHKLVVSHRQMLRAREVEFSSREESPERAVLDAHLVAADGERYLARFTMVRVAGRWWIDDIRWSAERSRHLIAV